MATSKDKGKSDKPDKPAEPKKAAAGGASDAKLANGDVARADDLASSLFVKAGGIGVGGLALAVVLGTMEND